MMESNRIKSKHPILMDSDILKGCFPQIQNINKSSDRELGRVHNQALQNSKPIHFTQFMENQHPNVYS